MVLLEKSDDDFVNEEIICRMCKKSFPKSNVNMCRKCGLILCSECHKNHICGDNIVYDKKIEKSSQTEFTINARKHYENAVLLKNSGKYNDAIDEYNIAFNSHFSRDESELFSAYTDLGNCYYNIENYEDALKSYNKAIELNPNQFSEYCNVGKIYYYLKKYKHALSYLDKGLSFNSNHADSWKLKSEIYIYQNHQDSAIKALMEYVNLSAAPDYRLLSILSKLCYKNEKYELAVRYINQTLNQDDSNFKLWEYLGLSYLKLNKYSEARTALKTSLEKIQNNDPSKKSIENALYEATNKLNKFNDISNQSINSKNYSACLKESEELR